MHGLYPVCICICTCTFSGGKKNQLPPQLPLHHGQLHDVLLLQLAVICDAHTPLQCLHGRASFDYHDAEFVLVAWVVMVAMVGELLGWQCSTQLFYLPECMLSSYMNSEQWLDSGTFCRKMLMTYGSFAKLRVLVCYSLSPAIKDSICTCTRAVRVPATRQLKVGVWVWYMANGWSWGVCADV